MVLLVYTLPGIDAERNNDKEKDDDEKDDDHKGYEKCENFGTFVFLWSRFTAFWQISYTFLK